MEFEVVRICEGGRVQQQHVRVASRARGVLSIKQEQDETRRRAVLVARLHGGSHMVGPAPTTIPALYDVQLIAARGEVWTLAGFERIQAGPLQYEVSVAQTWMISLAAADDLIRAEQQWQKVSLEAHELRQELERLRAEIASRSSS